MEMRGTDIHPILIEPGPITSRFRSNARMQFERWIDWENSAREADYRAGLQKRLYAETGPDTFELPPAAVTRKLIHAVEARRPRARYAVTVPTHVMGAARRILPTRALDWILSKA